MIRNSLITFLAITLGFANAMEGAAAAAADELDMSVTFIAGLSGNLMPDIPDLQLSEGYFRTLCELPDHKVISGPLKGVFDRHLFSKGHQILEFVKRNNNLVSVILDGVDPNFRFIKTDSEKSVVVEVSAPGVPLGTTICINFNLAPDAGILADFLRSFESTDTTTLSALNNLGLRPLIQCATDHEGGYAFVKATPFNLEALFQCTVGIPESIQDEVVPYFYVVAKNTLDIVEGLSIMTTSLPKVEGSNFVFLGQLGDIYCYRILVGTLNNRRNLTIMDRDYISYHLRLTEYNLAILQVISLELKKCTNSFEIYEALLIAGAELTDA